VDASRIGITTGPVLHDGLPADLVDRRYVDAVAGAGGVPVLLPVLDPDAVERALAGVDGLLLTGGDDVESGWYRDDATVGVPSGRDAFELELVRVAVERRRPILGICRGHQVLNVALGGTLVPNRRTLDELDLRDPEAPHRFQRNVHIASGSLLAAVVGATDVTITGVDHQAVGYTGAGLQVVATSVDGHVVGVEGLGDLRALGIEWHPERLLDQSGHAALFEWLVREASSAPSGSVSAVAPGAGTSSTVSATSG